MDKVVHKRPSPKEKKRLQLLQEELEGQELTALLERLQKQFDLSVNQIAKMAGIEMSALHKILKGENRQFKPERVDQLLYELEEDGKFPNPYEKAIWQRALRIAACLHVDLYKRVEPRVRQIEDVEKRLEVLKIYLKAEYHALAEEYDKTGGTFPVFIPFIDALAQELHKRWEQIRVPPGCDLGQIGENYYKKTGRDRVCVRTSRKIHHG